MADQRVPASWADAVTEREKLVPEIQRLQNFMTGIGLEQEIISAHDYHRKRTDAVRRLTQLNNRASFLRRWMRENQLKGPAGQNPQLLAMAEAYRLLDRAVELIPGGSLDAEIEVCLSHLEQFIPIAMLEKADA